MIDLQIFLALFHLAISHEPTKVMKRGKKSMVEKNHKLFRKVRKIKKKIEYEKKIKI